MRLIPRLTRDSRQQAGDTIVEVLIAVAIVGAVLAGAFTVSQKSVVAVRSSQEQGEMLQILQSQIELVRAHALVTSPPVTGVYATNPRYFCMSETTKLRVPQPRLGQNLPAIDNDDYTNYETACKFGPNDLYSVAIRYDAGTANPGDEKFTFVGRWDRIGGGKNQEQLSYRVYPTR